MLELFNLTVFKGICLFMIRFSALVYVFCYDKLYVI